ncbi:MAG TPA: hypothetical protein VLM43_15560, partial [Desulfobacterales bacterium]|nr:hypothetical protein [Desulfobacterales bacterium]
RSFHLQNMGEQQGCLKLRILDICLFQTLNSFMENVFYLHVVKEDTSKKVFIFDVVFRIVTW